MDGRALDRASVVEAGDGPEAPSAAAAPWEHAIYVTPPPETGELSARRALRYSTRTAGWRVSNLRRVAMCGRVVVTRGGVAEVHRVEGEDGPRGTVRGLATCGSIWACAVCSAHIRQVRADDIMTGCERHQDAGGGLAMLTLTVRHQADEALSTTLDGLLDAWRRTIRGAPWARTRERYGVAGYIRSVEVTWGAENGWHPHLHVLLVLDEALSEGDTVTLQAWLYRRWRAMVERVGLGEPSWERGVRLESVGRGAGAYVAKVQERSVALEMTRGDLKRGRGERWLPFELLWAAGNGETLAVRLWHEYEAATQGRRAIHWSQGLRDRWGLGSEQDDEAIVCDDQTTEDSLLLEVTADEWATVTRAGLDYAVIEAAESGDDRELAAAAVRDVISQAAVLAMALPRRRRRGV